MSQRSRGERMPFSSLWSSSIRSKKEFFCSAIIFVAALLLPLTAWGQQATAQLSGKVTDPSGAVVVGAKVTLMNPSTGVSRQTTTNKDGDYLFTLVPIGTYSVAVEESKFRKYEQNGITLDINQNAKVDVAMRIGSATEVVEVNDNATQVDTTSATL